MKWWTTTRQTLKSRSMSTPLSKCTGLVHHHEEASRQHGLGLSTIDWRSEYLSEGSTRRARWYKSSYQNHCVLFGRTSPHPMMNQRAMQGPRWYIYIYMVPALRGGWGKMKGLVLCLSPGSLNFVSLTGVLFTGSTIPPDFSNRSSNHQSV